MYKKMYKIVYTSDHNIWYFSIYLLNKSNVYRVVVSLKYQVKNFNSFRSLRFESPRAGKILNWPNFLRLERYEHSEIKNLILAV